MGSLEYYQNKLIQYCFHPKKTRHWKTGHIQTHAQPVNRILTQVYKEYGEETANNLFNDVLDSLKEVDEIAYSFLETSFNFGCIMIYED